MHAAFWACMRDFVHECGFSEMDSNFLGFLGLLAGFSGMNAAGF